MGWQDRDYAKEQSYHGGRRPAFRGSGMGTWDMVNKIIIANIVIYFITSSTSMRDSVLGFGLMQADSVLRGEIWRMFTATYLHANFMHILFNMMMLYFFGPILERRWGPRQFFIVYTIGGIAGNFILTLAGGFGWMNPEVFGLGASGSLWAIMGAAAIYFPNAEVLIYFILPVRLRTLVIVYFIWFVYNISQGGSNYGGDICHLAGLLVGLWWAKTGGWSWASGSAVGVGPRPGGSHGATGWLSRIFKRGGAVGGGAPTTFRGRMKQRQTDAETADRILAKVYDRGIHSLSTDERQALKEATDRLRAEEARAGRT